MSRSYKKHSFNSICSSYGDKFCRSYYHKSERRKVKKILKEEIREGIEKPVIWNEEMCTVCMDTRAFFDYDIPYEKYGVDYPTYEFDGHCCCYKDNPRPSEKIINGIDYSLKYSDKWAWASDGGAYYHSDLTELRRDFNREVFSGYYNTVNAWCRSRDYDIWSRYQSYVNKKHNTDKPTMTIALRKNVKVSKHWNEILKCYFDVEDYEKKFIEAPYNKQHKYDPSIIPEGWEVYSIYKKRGYGWDKENRWKEVRFSMIPDNFTTKEQLIDWLRNNEERMIKTIYRLRYGK